MISLNIQSSILISGNVKIYFDPIKMDKKYDADYIFITHSHYDHFSKEDILNIKKNNAVDMAIMQAKGKNTKAIKALIDMEKVTLKDDGTLEGLDIEGLKKSDSYLFDVEKVKTEGTGFSGGSGFSDNDNINSIVANAMGVK